MAAVLHGIGGISRPFIGNRSFFHRQRKVLSFAADACITSRDCMYAYRRAHVVLPGDTITE
jgi:hypothetical protein